ncbi:MAG: DUF4388 domain-containing protein [Thermoanaerobaculia bacterium]|nr:DUF4388 domain-containing protein [Thermoanaerobaculia bacterium]
MSINGNLKTMELAELFQWLAQSGKPGTLVIHNGRVEKRIVFADGAIIATASSDPNEYLGHFLVSYGHIDETILVKAMEMQESNQMMLGKILLTIGAISEAALDRMLRLKAEETIYDLFTWPEGEFRFLDDDMLPYKMVPLKLNVTAVVLEGAQRVDDWKRIRERIPSAHAVPVAVAEVRAPEDQPLHQIILSLVDDDRTIEEIALHCHTSEYQVCRALYEPILEGAIKIVRPRVVRERPADDVGRVRNGLDGASLLEAAAGYLASGEFELALRHLRAAQSLEPESKTIRQEIERADRKIRRRLAEEGIEGSAVPTLKRSLEDLTQLDITPQEGFILTRINDIYDIRTILKISPMKPLDALLVFRRLVRGGHIGLSKPGSSGS